MEEPAPPPGFLARAEEYADAATIPRLLVPARSRRRGERRTRRYHRSVSEFLVITGLSGAGRSQAAVQPRGPRLVRDRQPAGDADPEGRRAGRRAGLDHRAGRPGRRHAVRTTAMSCPALGAPEGGRPSGAHPVPRGADRRAGAPLREHPPPPPARRRHRLARRGDRARAAAARAGEGRGRRRRRHQRPQRAPAARPADGDLFADEAPAPGMQTTIMSFGLQARAAPRRRPRARLPLPARTPTGSRTCAPSPGSTSTVAAFVLQQDATVEFLGHLDSLLSCCSRPTCARASATSRSPSAAPAAATARSSIAEEVARRLRQHGLPAQWSCTVTSTEADRQVDVDGSRRRWQPTGRS